jgi:MFS family permease
VRNYGTLEAGVRTIPFAIFTGIAAPSSARLAARFGTKRVVATGLAMMAIGFFGAALYTTGTAYAFVVLTMLFMGSGLGLVNAPATEAIMGSLPPEKAGVGSAVNDTTRELGGTLGVAIVGSLFSSLYGSALVSRTKGMPIPAAALGAAKESVGAAVEVAEQAGRLHGAQAGAAVKHAVDSAFMSGFRGGSLAAAGVVVIGVVLAALYLPARARKGVADEIVGADVAELALEADLALEAV